MLSADLTNTLRALETFLAETNDLWWILGSAAVALKGYHPGMVRDVDVLVSAKDAERLMARWGLENHADGGTGRYRSSYFLLPDLGPVRVEIMAEYQINYNNRWQNVRPTSRQSVVLDNALLFVPADADLISIFEWLDRDKDRQRITAMKQA